MVEERGFRPGLEQGVIKKGDVLVDQNDVEWVVLSDPDPVSGEFRCGNEFGMGTGNVNIVVVKDAERQAV